MPLILFFKIVEKATASQTLLAAGASAETILFQERQLMSAVAVWVPHGDQDVRDVQIEEQVWKGILINKIATFWISIWFSMPEKYY